MLKIFSYINYLIKRQVYFEADLCGDNNMFCFNIIFVLGLSGFVLSEETLLTPCDVHDSDCLTKSTQTFLEQTSKGIPQYDIKAIDPLFMPSVDVVLNDVDDIFFHYKNLTIIGLKNQKFSYIKMDTQAKSVRLQNKVEVDISGFLATEFKKQKKTVSGPLEIKGTALVTANYGYDFKTDDKGVEHYEVGPETITCDALSEPIVTVGPELNEAVDKDAALKAEKEKYNSNRIELKKKQFCEIISVAFVTVVHNIRASAKIFPKTAFLKGI